MRYMFVMMIVLLVLSISGCDKKGTVDQIKDVLISTAVDSLADTYQSPDVLEAFHRDGWDGVKDVAPSIFFSNFKLRASSLATGGDIDKLAYKWIQENLPTVSRMILRDEGGLQVGIWIDLDTLAKSRGYPGAALTLFFDLTPDERQWLIDNAPDIILPHYLAVTGKPITDSVNGIKLGGF